MDFYFHYEKYTFVDEYSTLMLLYVSPVDGVIFSINSTDNPFNLFFHSGRSVINVVFVQ